MSGFCIDTDFNIMFWGLYLASFNVKLGRSEKDEILKLMLKDLHEKHKE